MRFMKTKTSLISKPPVVVVMGHIDHGKSTLLDYIRKTNVAGKEAGGITQHIGAYEAEVEHDGAPDGEAGKKRKITFLDTPGHEAFSQMRIRGAKTADVAILVAAADDDVQPQTVEAHNAIKQAGIPFVVAINKIDKPVADAEKVKTQLAEKGIYLEGRGGAVPFVNISAKTGQSVAELLDLVIILADMKKLEADPNENASGLVIESGVDPKRGITSTLLIQNGTMKKGMFVVAGTTMSPIRIFEDFKGLPIEKATFSSPVRITGFNKFPLSGDKFKTYSSKKEAEEAMNLTEEKTDKKELAKKVVKTTEKENKVVVQIIIKADLAGSLEPLEKELMKLQDEEISLTILRGGAGNINEDDVKFASASKNSVILGFNVSMDAVAKEIVERYGVPSFISNIIYDISDWLKKEIAKRKAEIPREEIIGAAKILKTFSRQKNKQVIGGRVISGKLIEGKSFKIKRRDAEIGEGEIANLQQGKKEVKEVAEGMEFGAMTENKIEIAKDDEIIIVGK